MRPSPSARKTLLRRPVEAGPTATFRARCMMRKRSNEQSGSAPALVSRTSAFAAPNLWPIARFDLSGAGGRLRESAVPSDSAGNRLLDGLSREELRNLLP